MKIKSITNKETGIRYQIGDIFGGIVITSLHGKDDEIHIHHSDGALFVKKADFTLEEDHESI